ncbi:MAG: fructose 1,6-bisphosphatase [Deltaproteobacteria bacterium]|nr:fructose 1,6-bisphosphatase [Deltaproteobacteria bacterium]
MPGEPKVTLSVATADVGGFVGHVSIHPELLDTAKERLYGAREKGAIIDFHVLRCGDDIELLMTHENGPDDREVHELAWNTFKACQEAAVELKLYAAEKGMVRDVFTGSLRRMGPGIAEIEFIERKSEPVLVLMANKTSVGVWNLPLYRIFADPFNTPGLILDPAMLDGFSFRILDLKEGKEITLRSPEEMHYLLALAGSVSRYVISSVHRNSDREPVAVISSQKCNIVGGKITARCEPAVVFRCHVGFPAVGEVMEAFAFPHLVEGWMRGSHIGPLMPVPFYEANPTRFDGPPRVIAAGFQVTDGRLIGPHDMFDDPSFDEARRTANQVTDYMRRHGPFQPHRMPQSEMEYTAMPIVLDKLKDKFKKIE